MRRAHRTAHRRLWPILAIVVATGFVLALWLRPPPEPGQVRAIPPAAPMEQTA